MTTERWSPLWCASKQKNHTAKNAKTCLVQRDASTLLRLLTASLIKSLSLRDALAIPSHFLAASWHAISSPYILAKHHQKPWLSRVFISFYIYLFWSSKVASEESRSIRFRGSGQSWVLSHNVCSHFLFEAILKPGLPFCEAGIDTDPQGAVGSDPSNWVGLTIFLSLDHQIRYRWNDHIPMIIPSIYIYTSWYHPSAHLRIGGQRLGGAAVLPRGSPQHPRIFKTRWKPSHVYLCLSTPHNTWTTWLLWILKIYDIFLKHPAAS